MNFLKVKGAQRLTDETRYDPRTGDEYRATTWRIGGRFVEINQDAHGTHARADGDPRTAEANMDEGGLFNWLRRMLT